MTTIHIHTMKCDGCEKEVPLDHASGWYAVNEIVTDAQRYAELTQRAEATGISGAISGDFCTLTCLQQWAVNAGTTQGMEGLFNNDPEDDDDPRPSE